MLVMRGRPVLMPLMTQVGPHMPLPRCCLDYSSSIHKAAWLCVTKLYLGDSIFQQPPGQDREAALALSGEEAFAQHQLTIFAKPSCISWDIHLFVKMQSCDRQMVMCRWR